MTPNAVAQSLWELPYDIHTFGVHFPCRTTIVQLETGGLLLYSPGPVDESTALAIEAIGPVEHLVAPSRFRPVTPSFTTILPMS